MCSSFAARPVLALLIFPRRNISAGRGRDCSGFTLVEIVIVLIIMGIAAGLIGLYIGRGSGTFHMRTLAKDIASTLRYARNHAVSEKTTYCFVVDLDEGKYRLYKGGDENAVVVISDTLPDDLDIGFDRAVDEVYDIEFFPYGNSSGGMIELSKGSGRGMVVSVDRLSGRVEVSKKE
jgi:general secretion pathway protein H